MDAVTPDRVRLSVDEARAVAEQALRRIGYDAEEAAIVADHVLGCSFVNSLVQHALRQLLKHVSGQKLDYEPSYIGVGESSYVQYATLETPGNP